MRHASEKLTEDRVGVEIVPGKAPVHILMIIVVVEIVVFSPKSCHGSAIVPVKSTAQGGYDGWRDAQFLHHVSFNVQSTSLS